MRWPPLSRRDESGRESINILPPSSTLEQSVYNRWERRWSRTDDQMPQLLICLKILVESSNHKHHDSTLCWKDVQALKQHKSSLEIWVYLESALNKVHPKKWPRVLTKCVCHIAYNGMACNSQRVKLGMDSLISAHKNCPHRYEKGEKLSLVIAHPSEHYHNSMFNSSLSSSSLHSGCWLKCYLHGSCRGTFSLFRTLKDGVIFLAFIGRLTH